MKPLWVHTLVWIAAIAAVLVFALLGPDGSDFHTPWGAVTPR